MNTDRISGPTPPPSSSSSRGGTAGAKSFREALEKVEKISEIDPDEPSRQKYQAFQLQQANAKKSAEAAAIPISPGPASPFFSAPPTPSSAPSSPALSAAESTSPQSEEFWESFEAETFESERDRSFEEIPAEERKKKESSIRAIEEEGEAETSSQRGKKRSRSGGDASLKASPIAPAVALEAESLAQAAAVQAAPYLHPEAQLLFEKMIGTLFMMLATPSVLHIEVLLNSPAFAKSLFYGSTITIRRYAFAANAMNVEFSGPDEAVNLFQAHIPSLMTAFQKGRFAFTVDRIEAVYGRNRKVQRKQQGDTDT